MSTHHFQSLLTFHSSDNRTHPSNTMVRHHRWPNLYRFIQGYLYSDCSFYILSLYSFCTVAPICSGRRPTMWRSIRTTEGEYCTFFILSDPKAFINGTFTAVYYKNIRTGFHRSVCPYITESKDIHSVELVLYKPLG